MTEERIYIEENRFCQESNCKFLKRLVVGFIRFIESGDQEANIPEHFFNNVPDNLGFNFEFLWDEDGNDLRGFKLIENWKMGMDDCGGKDCGHPDDANFSIDKNGSMTFTLKNKKNHLKLVKNVK